MALYLLSLVILFCIEFTLVHLWFWFVLLLVFYLLFVAWLVFWSLCFEICVFIWLFVLGRLVCLFGNGATAFVTILIVAVLLNCTGFACFCWGVVC